VVYGKGVKKFDGFHPSISIDNKNQMQSFQIKGLGQLDDTTSWLERTLEDRQENAESVGEAYLLRTLGEIVADLRDASTNIRQETQEAMRLAEEKYRGSVVRREEMEDKVRTLLNRQEVLKDEKIRDLEKGHDEECQLRMEAQAQLKEAQAELGRWRVAVAHERAWNGGNLRGKSAAAECERLEAKAKVSGM
jgi:outer membrane lipopolysaccharide assembly protein LptE/RlpB